MKAKKERGHTFNFKRHRFRSLEWQLWPQFLPFLTLFKHPHSTHLTDLKEITHDFLYENYRTEKLSRTVHSDYADTAIPGDELANQSVRLKEEQLRKEEDKLREIELKVQREIQEKRQELMAKEESLRNLENRLAVSKVKVRLLVWTFLVRVSVQQLNSF